MQITPAAARFISLQKPKASFAQDTSQPQAASGMTLERWDVTAAWLLKKREDLLTPEDTQFLISQFLMQRPDGRPFSCLLAPLPGDPGGRTEDIVGCQTDRKTLSLGAATNPQGHLLQLKKLVLKA